MLKSAIDRGAAARRAAGAVVSAALAASAVATFRYAPAEPATDRPAATTARTDAAAAVPSGPAPSTLPPFGGRAPGPSVPASGPGITSAGIRLVALPHPDGTFEVAETIVFRQPRDRLVLTSPDVRHGGGSFARKSPVADQVQVSVDGEPVAVGVVRGTRTVELPAGTVRVELRYLLAGATVRSIPSVAGRALGLLSPLTGANDRTLPAALEIDGPAVRNLICPQLAPEKQQCAATTGGLGVAPVLQARQATVIVQYNLPKPS